MCSFVYVLLYSVIQLLSCVVAHLLLTMVDSCCLTDNCKVTSRSYRKRMADNSVSHKLNIVVFHSEPVIFLASVPFFYLDYNINLLGIFNALNTVKSLYIDDTDTAKLDKMSCNIWRRSDYGNV